MPPRSLLLLVVGVSACLSADSSTERSGWGLNGHGECGEASLHCWSGGEADRIRVVADALDEAPAQAPDARGPYLAGVVDQALEMSAKLSSAQVADLRALSAELAASPTLDDAQTGAAVRSVREAGVLELEAGLLGAHMAVLEPMIQAQIDGMPAAAAGAVDPFAWAKDVVIPSDYPPHLKSILTELMSTPLGAITAGMLIFTGVLRNDYRRENAELFGEYVPASGSQPERYLDSGLSPMAKVDQIVATESLFAAGVGAATQGGSLLLPPAAGALAGVGIEMLLLFKINMKMAMRIAQVYRWDLNSGPALLMLIARVQFEGLAGAALDQFVSYNVMTEIVSKTLTSRRLRQFGLTSSDDIMKFMFTSLWDRLKGGWSQEAMEAAAREVLEQGTKATVKQLLGWATLGAMVVVSAGLDYGATRFLGWRLKWTTWTWMRDLMHQGSTVMGEREVRDCAFETYGRIVGADGEIRDNEKRLLLAYLTVPFWESEAAKKTIAPEEIQDHAVAVKTASALAPPADEQSATAPACVTTALADADEQHRTVFLAHLYAMMQIDLDEDPAERWIYQKVRAALTQGGLFRRFDESLLGEVERAVELEIGLARGVVVDAGGRSFNTSEDFGITIEDIAPAMKDENIQSVVAPFTRGWGEAFLAVPAAPATPPQQ